MMNIYIANLSSRLKENHIRELFEAFGEVCDVKIIKDFATGLSKGIGFVEMKYDSDGKVAIEKLNRCELDGHRMVVAKAKESAGGNKKRKS